MELFLQFTDNYDDEHRRQEVTSSDRGVDIFFCAEDLDADEAKIGGLLFDGKDFIEALRLGMRLAQQGYSSIVVAEEPWYDV